MKSYVIANLSSGTLIIASQLVYCRMSPHPAKCVKLQC